MTVRYMRKTAILAALEATYAEVNPATPFATTDALLVRNAKFRIARDTEPRELIHPHLGGSEHMVAARRAEIEFEVEFAGSGAAGTAPAWGKLLRACGMSENIVAGSRVEYLPVSGAFESLRFRYAIDGVRYATRGSRGSVKFVMSSYKIPVLQFKFWGFDAWAAENAEPLSGGYAAWKRPLVLSDANAGDIRLDGTFSGGWSTGGTVLPSQGLEIDLANKLSHVKLLGGESIDITDRDPMGKISVALSAADEVTWRSEINANALSSLGFNFGDGAGSRVHLWCPSVQRVDPQAEAYEGRVLMQSELRVLPTAAGNDELRVVAR